MKMPNEFGVYEPEIVETLAKAGRSYAEIKFSHCEDDGLWRYALSMNYGYGGFDGPISQQSAGYTSQREARDTGIVELLTRYPEPWLGDPQSVHDDLQRMREIIKRGFTQPSLF